MLPKTPDQSTFKKPSPIKHTSSLQAAPSPIRCLPVLNSIAGDKDGETPVRTQQHFSRVTEDNSPIGLSLQLNAQHRNDVILACVQHGLDTTASLIQAFIKHGMKPENIYFLGKSYSTCPNTIAKLKKLQINIQESLGQYRLGEFAKLFKQDIQNMLSVIEQAIAAHIPFKMIFLDDGGRLLKAATNKWQQYHRYGIEQTTAGFRELWKHPPDYPWISIATCDLKQLEPPFIAEVVAQKISKILKKSENLSCGIIGLGNIGEAVATKLLELGHAVVFYDPEKDGAKLRIKRCNTREELVKSCEYIIGCTGKNTFKGADFAAIINGNKKFISCSSEDKEFKALLQKIQKIMDARNGGSYTVENPLADLSFQYGRHTITIYRGGFPINFDNTKHSVETKKIEPTRIALFGGWYTFILQNPREKIQTPKMLVGLNPKFQEEAKQLWEKNMQTAQIEHASCCSAHT